MFANIQRFSFSNIDTYSTSSLVTRLTTDVTNIQNSYQMILRMGIRGPFSLAISMCMAFVINARLATIYLVAAIFLGFVLVTIATKTMKYFRQVFEKYDEEVDEETLDIIFPPDEVLDRCQMYTDLPQETLVIYNDLWTKLGV